MPFSGLNDQAVQCDPYGVLGSETMTATASQHITGISGQVQSIACNERHSAVLTGMTVRLVSLSVSLCRVQALIWCDDCVLSDEGLYTFGINVYGALGRTGKQAIPAKVDLKVKLTQIACGLDHTIGLSGMCMDLQQVIMQCWWWWW
jgi:hypothetical protein